MRFHLTRIAPRLIPTFVLAGLVSFTFARQNQSDVRPMPLETPATIDDASVERAPAPVSTVMSNSLQSSKEPDVVSLEWRRLESHTMRRSTNADVASIPSYEAHSRATRHATQQDNAGRASAPPGATVPDKAHDSPAAARDQDAQISEYVRKVFQDREGNFWFGTNNDGVARHDGKTLEYFGVQDGFGGSAVRGILQDDVGVVWFATEGGVSCYKDGKFTNFMLGAEPGDNDLWSMMRDRFGSIWLGTRNGVRRFDGTRFIPFHLPRVTVENPQSRFSPLVVFAMTQDRAGNLWFGTDGEGVHKYDGRTFTSYTTAQGLGGNQVRSVYADRHGRIWVGTDGGGVTCIDGAAIRTFTANDGLNNDRVFGVLEDRAGNMWFSTLGAGACRYDGATFTAFREDRGLTRSHVQCMHEAKDGTLWFGCSGGLFRLEGERFVNVTRNGPWRTEAQAAGDPPPPVATVDPAEVVGPMANFSRLIGGHWKMTTAAGRDTYDTWQWGPGKQSIQSMRVGTLTEGDPWRVLTVYYWHPTLKEVRLLSVGSVWRGVGEGKITLSEDSAETVVVLNQTVGQRNLRERWTFEGPDKYHDELSEKVRDEYELLTGWDRRRVDAAEPADRATNLVLAPASTPSELLRPLEKIFGHTWASIAEPKADFPRDAGDLRTRTTFEYVPEADAIYGRVETSAESGALAHAMDIYLYHHTGAGVLRCLALANFGPDGTGEAVVYEGDVTPLDDGRAIRLDLKCHRADAATTIEVRIDFGADGTVRQRVWSIEGENRSLTLDVSHAKRDPRSGR